MLEFLSWFAGRRTPTAPASRADLDRRIDLGTVSLERLLAEPARAARLRRCAAFLPDLGVDLSGRLVEGVARHFLSYVVDLPASEKHHHACAFGLFDHSLEVAELALRSAQSRWFVSTTCVYPDRQAFRIPRLRYATWFFALLHDAGKILQVVIHGPALATWNPYVEPLSEFYSRHGRENCLLSWRAGRGLDAHVWHTAYLNARLIVESVGTYLGESIISEVLEQKSDAAKEIAELVSAADQASTREAIARQAREGESPIPNAAASVLGVAVGEYLDRIPEILARAIREGILRTNRLDAEVLVGRWRLLLRYPAALQKLALLIRDAVGREFAEARALSGSEEGARALCHYLHRHRKLFYDPETDTWKVKVKLEIGSEFDVTGAVLLDRGFLEPALGSIANLECFAGHVAAQRFSDGAPLGLDDFEAPPAAAVTVLTGPTEPPRPAAAPTAVTQIAAPAPAPQPPAFLGTPAPPVVGLRKFISAEILLDDIRGGILAGWIPTNVWNGQCYVLEDVTYLASPRGFQKLVEKGLYSRDPKRELNAYLDALAKLPCVRKDSAGRVLRQIAIRPGARPLWVVAFDTQGLFRTQEDLARVGVWSETPVREMSEAEARALVQAVAAAAAPQAALGTVSLAPAPGVAHA